MDLKQEIALRPVIGTWCDIPSVQTAHVLASAGLDFIIIDMEHGPAGYESVSGMCLAAEAASGCVPLVRVSSNSESAILRSLDSGAKGLIIPHIRTPQDRERALSWSRFPPEGGRGFNPFCQWGGYGAPRRTLAEENASLFCGVIVEDREALERIDDILDDHRLDLVYIGVYDLSVSLGFPGQTAHPSVQSAVDRILEAAVRKGKPAGAMALSPADIAALERKGIRFIAYGVDTGVLFQAYHSVRHPSRGRTTGG
jgi:4-hydroxy-2-oxoheptanedioate aldolase